MGCKQDCQVSYLPSNAFNNDDCSSEDDALKIQTNQHNGAVHTLDVNPFQANLFASGAGDSEIFIWDLNNPTVPMSPGNKLHPLEDVSCVSWNRQVQHILGSSSPSGRSVVWDLRKNEPIIQISDSSSKVTAPLYHTHLPSLYRYAASRCHGIPT